MKQYDAIIIGFGKGGKLLAAELANRNWKVAIIERSPQMYGGTCVNVGCIPTKALIYESEQAERLYRDDYGNQAKYYALAIRRKNKLVSFLRDKNHERIKEHPNITLYDGTASFVSDDTVKVVSHDKKEILLKGKEVFINTGATPILPAVKGIDASKHVFTSETLLQQSKLPGRLLILGAGAIGMEFATMYAGFGSKVMLLETGSRFMPKADRDIAESMLESLKRKGIEIRLNAYALSVYDTADGITLTYTDNSDNTPYFWEGDAVADEVVAASIQTGKQAVPVALDVLGLDAQLLGNGAGDFDVVAHEGVALIVEAPGLPCAFQRDDQLAVGLDGLQLVGGSSRSRSCGAGSSGGGSVGRAASQRENTGSGHDAHERNKGSAFHR